MVLEIGSELFYRVVYSIAIIIGMFIAVRIIDGTLFRFAKRARLEPHTVNPIIKLVNVLIYGVTILFLLGTWGLSAPLSALLTGAGIAGIVIGFATKDILGDLLAGIMLFFDRPFKIGHAINLNDIWGSVLDIGIRSTKVKTFDGKFVTIPNSVIAKSIVTNLSVYEDRRLEVEVGVDYDTDLKKAKRAVERAVKRLEREGMIKEEPKTRVVIDSFGDNSINFKILFWYNNDYMKEHDMMWLELRGELVNTIKREFDRDKISIPFPQVTLSERRKKKI